MDKVFPIASSTKIDDAICPICKTKNNCQTQHIELCWCNAVIIPEVLLALIPQESRNKACICSACIESFNRNPIKFISAHS
ncbi:MAG: cysteine-rich CWC family protein [gamma proteobacterium symbiont of Taylorina sp.]|nr:cysteine-rich CWC family protein [gamma proteobacterium symbiont of Taylorina sp.]